jgi:hypothetical protein
MAYSELARTMAGTKARGLMSDAKPRNAQPTHPPTAASATSPTSHNFL